MNSRVFRGIVLVSLLLSSHLGCAQDTTPEKRKVLAEIEVSRAEQPKEASRFKRDKDSEEYSFHTQSWSRKLPKSIGAMTSDEASDFVIKIVSDNSKRWFPKWLAEVQTPHPGPDSPHNPMKPTIHSYVVDAWTGKVIESEQHLVPIADVNFQTEPVPSPPVKDSKKKTSNKPDAPDKK